MNKTHDNTGANKTTAPVKLKYTGMRTGYSSKSWGIGGSRLGDLSWSGSNRENCLESQHPRLLGVGGGLVYHKRVRF